MTGAVQRVAISLAMRARARAKKRKIDRRVALVGIVALLAANVGTYFLPIDYGSFSTAAYPGVFLICLIANAAVALPIPYIPIVAQVAATAEHVWLVVVAAALGSVLGESVAFLVGRAEKGLVSEHRLYKRLERIARHPIRTALVLFAFAVPLNPVFDVGGIAAGALGVPYRTFFGAVFLARLVRMAIIAWLGIGLVGFGT